VFARFGFIDRTAQRNLCNLLRSDTPKQLALIDVTDALNAPAIGSLLAHFPMAGGPRLNA
jgi:hypothetical protein